MTKIKTLGIILKAASALIIAVTGIIKFISCIGKITPKTAQPLLYFI